MPRGTKSWGPCMGERRVPAATGKKPLCRAGAEPGALPSPDALNVTTMLLASGTVLHRIHLNRYRADRFNRGRQGNARFSPIRDARGKLIPTLYGGSSMDCAMMETVFHDVPHTAGLKIVDRAAQADLTHSRVGITRDLEVVNLANVPLRKLGVSRRQLIDTGRDHYPATRNWAEALHQICPQAQGLCWISRQDDTGRAVMLFGDRIPFGVLRAQGDSRSLVDDLDARDAVLDLAERLGVAIVARD